jgi:hypothetical protein
MTKDNHIFPECGKVMAIDAVLGKNGMENIDWQNAIAGGLAAVIFIGGMLMMFTNIWTTKDR